MHIRTNQAIKAKEETWEGEYGRGVLGSTQAFKKASS